MAMPEPDWYLLEKCPNAWDGGTHHFIPKREGMARGTRGTEPAHVQACIYCGAIQRYDTANPGRVVLQPGRSNRRV